MDPLWLDESDGDVCEALEIFVNAAFYMIPKLQIDVIGVFLMIDVHSFF